MKNKKIKNRLKNKVVFSILVIILVNAITLTMWFSFKIYPLNKKTEEIKEELTQNGIKNNYEDYDSFTNDINKLKKKYQEYNLKVSINNIDSDIKSDKINKNDLFLFNKLISIDDSIYNINLYLNRNTNILEIALELITFQIIIILFTMLLMFIITSIKIINPIDIIIGDIRNYKLGKRPINKKLKGEFSIIHNEFIKLVDSIENEKTEQSRIIASISHDIKTPLTSIIGYSNIIDTNDLDINDIKKYNKKIYEKSLHIKDIVNTFDDYLVNQNNQVLKLDDIYIKDIASDLISDYKIDLSNDKIEFSVNNKCLDNDIIKVDILKLKRIFSNVISNSIRYLDKHGKINIDISKDNNNYKFIIRDNGTGCDKNVIDKVFDPLFTTDNSRKISGLGLSICYEFVKMHNGNIRCYNDNGFVVEFTIPHKPVWHKKVDY